MTELLTPGFEPVTPATILKARQDRVQDLGVPTCRYFAVDGDGAPGGPAFVAAFGALYPVAYALRFALKRRGAVAKVGRLEGLYWQRDDAHAPTPGRTAGASPDWRAWGWRLLLQVPADATDAEVDTAIAEARAKRGPDAIAPLYVWTFNEGPCAQTLHVGPYDTETATIERLQGAIASVGLAPRGVHHEIYLSDPNRTPPARLRTVIRQPVAPI